MSYSDKLEDDYSRRVVPVVANTEKDGSGTWYFLVVNSDGELVASDDV